MFRTITAKYPATCRRCKLAIAAGSRIRYGGRGLVYHLAADCPASQQPQPVRLPVDDAARAVPVSPADVDAAADWSIDAAMAERAAGYEPDADSWGDL